MKYIHRHVYSRLYCYLVQQKHVKGIDRALAKLNHRLDRVTYVSEKHFQELYDIVNKYDIPLQIHDFSMTELLDTYPEFAYVLNASDAAEAIRRYVQFKPIMGSRDRMYYRIDSEGNIVVHYVQDEGVINIYGPLFNLCFVTKMLLSFDLPAESMQICTNKLIPNIKDFERSYGVSIYTGKQNALILKVPFTKHKLQTNNDLLDGHLKRQLQHSLYQLESLNNLVITESVQLTLERLYQDDSLTHASVKLLKQIGLSRWTLARKLKKEGQTFDDLLCQFKQKKCYDVLSYTSVPLVVLSQRLGFQSQSSLNRFTIRHFGLSPMEIRNKVGKEELIEH